jgi:hypothetical protein
MLSHKFLKWWRFCLHPFVRKQTRFICHQAHIRTPVALYILRYPANYAGISTAPSLPSPRKPASLPLTFTTKPAATMSSSAVVSTGRERKPVKIKLPAWMNVPAVVQEFLRVDLQMVADESNAKEKHYLGYPNNLSLHNIIPKALEMIMINIADPRGNKYRGPNTHDYEHDIIDFLKELWDFPEGAKDWGSTCTGSTEAVLTAVLRARDQFKGRNPIVYYNKEAHYCVPKAAHITGLEGRAVNMLEDASMDTAHLARLLEENKGRPAIVVATCGTTVREGHDDIAAIVATLKTSGTDHYVHVDAALCGATAPFLDEIQLGRKPSFLHGVVSISGSLQKFFGANRPGGVILGIVFEEEEKEQEEEPNDSGGIRVDYINANDTTPSGSRNGVAALGFWMRIIRYSAHAWGTTITNAEIGVIMQKTRSSQPFPAPIQKKIMEAAVEGVGREARMCADFAIGLARDLRKAGVPVFHNLGAITVYMPEPPTKICDKYTLACAPAKGLFGGKGAHVITMQHTQPILPEFVEEYTAWYNSSIVPVSV